MRQQGTGVDDVDRRGVYGQPAEGLKLEVAGAVQVSPLIPGAETLEGLADASLQDLVMVAPPGTVERRYAVALGLAALAADAPFTILAPKDRGGSRLGEELRAFGCSFEETGKRHHRICVGRKPAVPVGLAEAVEAGRLRLVEGLGLWSQPGIFSWDRLDPGTALLLEHLPVLSGRGADFGCGIGILAKAALAFPKVKSITLVDIDRRAVEAARRNVEDARAEIRWADLKGGMAGLANLDFVVMNPPFHLGGNEDQALGQGFVQRAATVLRRGGVLWLTANRHLPYETVLKPLFARVETRAEARGFKIIEAHK